MKKITIIGAGLGGLTAGALLAKDGYKVTLLEQHTIVGGCATTFKRGNFSCEVGLHEMDGVYTNPAIMNIFTELNIYNSLEFVSADEFFEVSTTFGKFKMPNGVDQAQQALIEKFPKEEKGIKRYFKTIAKVGDNFEKLEKLSWYHYAFFPFLFWNILYYKPKSVTDVLNSMIKDRELKLILNSNVHYYNDQPATLSFLLHAVAQNSYYRGGGWFIKGGSSQLSNYLAKFIMENKGEVITKASVVDCSEGRVVYIRAGETFNIETDITISNLSPAQTYQLYNQPYTEKRENGDAILTIYLGFSKSLKEIYGDKRAYTNFIFDEVHVSNPFKNSFTFVDYSQIDSGLTKNNKSFGVITMLDNIHIDEWHNLNRKNYHKKKREILAIMLEKLEKHYPNISNFVEYSEVATSKTVQRYIKTPNGTAYGFKPTPKQFFRLPKVRSNKIKNLYFTGQWVIAGGFRPAIMSGGMCRERINIQEIHLS